MVSYLKAFIQDPKVASIAPTPVSCIRKILNPIPLENCSLVVELGPGDGNFTREILHRLPAHGRLVCLETNDQFFSILERRFAGEPRVTVLKENALFLKFLLKFRKIGAADLIISGIPLSFLAPADRKSFFASLRDSISADGKILLYQVLSPGKEKALRNLGTSYFENINSIRLWNAIPPLVAVTFLEPKADCREPGAFAEFTIQPPQSAAGS